MTRHIAPSWTCDTATCSRSCSADPDVSWAALELEAVAAGWSVEGDFPDEQHFCSTHTTARRSHRSGTTGSERPINVSFGEGFQTSGTYTGFGWDDHA